MYRKLYQEDMYRKLYQEDMYRKLYQEDMMANTSETNLVLGKCVGMEWNNDWLMFHTFDRHQLIDFRESFPSFEVLMRKTSPIAHNVRRAGKRNQNDLKMRMTTASTKKMTPYRTRRQTCSFNAPMNPVQGMASKRAKTMVVATHAYLGPVDPPPDPVDPSPQMLSASGCVNLSAFSRNSVK